MSHARQVALLLLTAASHRFLRLPSLVQGGVGGGAVGLVSNLRSYLWIPISQNSYRWVCQGCVQKGGREACLA